MPSPVPRTRIEQVAGIRPPILRSLQHYAHELTTKYTPHPRWVLKWIAIGIFWLAIVSGVTVLVLPYQENKDAKETFTAARAKADEAKQKRDADEKAKRAKEANEKENQEITMRANANWEQWRDAFAGPTIGTACYHGNDFEARPKIYKITCHIGPKGVPPNLLVVCNEHGCGTPPVEKPPEPEKK